MEKMRIGVFTQQYNQSRSGVGTYATHLVQGLAARGHHVVVVAPHASAGSFGCTGAPIERITVRPFPYDPSIGGWMSLSLRYARLLRRHPALQSCDLYHFTDAREALFLPSVPKPSVGTMNDYYFADPPKNPLTFRAHYKDWMRRYCYYQTVHMLEPRALRKLTAIVCNSVFVKEALQRAYRIPEDKLHVIYYGIEAEPASRKENTGQLEGKPSLLFVGANFQRKGLPTLIRALAMLKTRYPQIKLYVAGSDANQKQMQRLCGAYGVLSHVVFLGGIDHLQALGLYAKATLFVMPSLIEGFGFVYLEAMRAGIPVIAGDVGGTKELIQDGYNGLLVGAGDVEGLYAKITMVLGDGQLRNTLIRNALATLARYTLRESIERTLTVYEKMRSAR